MECSRNPSPELLHVRPSLVDIKPLFGETRSLSGDAQSVFRDKRRLFADNPSGKEAGMGRPQPPRRGKKGKKTYSIYSSGQKKAGPGRQRKRSLRGLVKPPLIVVQQCKDSADMEDRVEEKSEDKVSRPKLSVMMSEASKKNSKRKPGPAAVVTKKKSSDMSHIRAKWLLGLSLTMVSTAHWQDSNCNFN